MKTEDLFEAFGDIDESFIISARKPVQKKDRTLFFLIPSFAAAVAVCAGVNHFTNIQPETQEYQIDSNLQSTVSEITEPNTETTESENTRIPVLSVNPEKETTVPQTETERNTSAGSEKEFMPQTEAYSEQVQIPETSVFTEAVKTETEPVTEPEEDVDLYKNLIGSFSPNAIVLDYTRDNRAVLVINEDGSQHYFEDGGTKAVVKLREGVPPPENEINEKLGTDSVRFIKNDDGTYTMNAGDLNEKVYEILKENNDVLSIDEVQTINEYDFSINRMFIDSDDSPTDIIEKYSELNLVSVPNPSAAPGENTDTQFYFCQIDRTPASFEALKKLQDSGVKYDLYIMNYSDTGRAYSEYSSNKFKR